MLESQLQKLGFHKNEVKIYLALFELGKCKAGKIIDYTGLHRNLVYNALKELIKNDLVSKVLVKGVAVFEANSPYSLVDLLDQKKTLAEEAVKELKKRQVEKSRDIKIYEGMEGIFRARRQILAAPKGETLYVLGASRFTTTPEYEQRWRKFHREREKKGIKLKILFENVPDKNIEEAIAWRNRLPLSQARYLPFNVDNPFFISFCKDILDFSTGGEDPLTFSLKNKRLVEGFKKYFEYFWNQDTQILQGPEALQKIWLESIDYQELRLIGARGYFIDRYPDLYKAVEEKTKKTPGIKWRNIVDSGVRGHYVTRLPWAETKYLLSGVKNPNVVWLYGPKVVITNWAGDEPIMFVSTNKQLVQSYNDYFEELWKTGR